MKEKNLRLTINLGFIHCEESFEETFKYETEEDLQRQMDEFIDESIEAIKADFSYSWDEIGD